MLSQTLRTLADDGFLDRHVTAATPPQVSYSLNDLGEGVTQHVVGLVEWIERTLPAIVEARLERAGS